MPFQLGQSGNPGGRTKKSWIKDRERMREAKTTWQKLLQIRDDLVLERKKIGEDNDGAPIMADVVPSVKDYITCCNAIMDRAVGKAAQAIELTGAAGGPIETIDRDLLRELSNNPEALELARRYAELRIAPSHTHNGNGSIPPA